MIAFAGKVISAISYVHCLRSYVKLLFLMLLLMFMLKLFCFLSMHQKDVTRQRNE